MKDRKNRVSDLQGAWETGIERASAQRTGRDELADPDLMTAAGLQINSGVKAGGLWSATCARTCGSCDCTNIC